MDWSPTIIRIVAPLTPPDEAEMVVLPPPTAVANPEALIVATAVFVESQLETEVRSLVLPSL